MKIAQNILGVVLGLLFLAASLTFLLNMVPDQPPPPEGSAMALFMGAFIPTGYMKFVKICELIGGILVAVPRTRNLGLLVLGPIIINILAFHIFITNWEGVGNPMLLTIVAITLFLLWSERRAFGQLVAAKRS
jgi:putative oxidoreductase